MDDRQRDVLMVASREAYRCLADRNRPEVMVEGRLIYSDAELAGALRHFARELFTMQAEHSDMMSELQPLWEAQISGALRRAVGVLEHLREGELRGWGKERNPVLEEGDLALLRVLAGDPAAESRLARRRSLGTDET
jgi:hypothetical protein